MVSSFALNPPNAPIGRSPDGQPVVIDRSWYRYFSQVQAITGDGLIASLRDAEYLTYSPNLALPNARTFLAGTALTLVPTSSTTTINLDDTIVTPGTYGSSSMVGTFTVDQQGRLTFAADVPITAAAIGATTVGAALFTLANPSAIRFLRVNADNSVSALDAATFRTAIGAGTGAGSVTSVAFSGGTTGLSASGGPITGSGTFTLSGTLVVSNGGTGRATITANTLQKGNGTSALADSQIIDNGTNVGINRATPAAKLDVNGSIAVADSSFFYTPYNGATDTATVRAGVQCDGASQGLNFYTSNAYRGGVDPSGNYRPGSDNLASCGTAGNRWSVVYAGTGAINTSDRRSKKLIGNVPAKWLDAWGEVEWCRFKYRPGKRWHVGLIAQQIHEAFARHGLDAFAIGLCCYDEWGDEHITVIGKRGKPLKQRRVRKAGNRWGLRYDECQAIEAAWQRRRLGRLEAQIEKLKFTLARATR